jgi:hypothetical protein
MENIEFKSEYYNETQIEFINISYGFKKGIIPNKENLLSNIPLLIVKDTKIPLSMNPLDYGRVMFKKDKLLIIQNKLGQTINFETLEEFNQIEIFKNQNLLLSFKDFKLNDSEFIRLIGNKKYHIKNNELVLQTMDFKSKFISTIKKSVELTEGFLTLDIETFINKDNILIPYLISFFDGQKSYSFYLSEHKNVEEMMINCFFTLFVRKYNGYKIYIHNLAKFDIIFLLKYLAKVGDLEPIIHHNKIISLKVKFGSKNQYQMEFKDSYLILLSSLIKLCKGFGVETIKTIFPHLFVNENNLDYIGAVPNIENFFKISISDYNNYKNSFIV